MGHVDAGEFYQLKESVSDRTVSYFLDVSSVSRPVPSIEPIESNLASCDVTSTPTLNFGRGPVEILPFIFPAG